jgi:predicted metalloprotease with PDZ domain
VSDFRYAIGIQVKKDGTVSDVVPDSAGWKAGVAPGMTVVAVNDLKYSGSRLRDAVRANKSIRLILENGESYLTAEIPDTGVERYPHLVRGGGDDLLGAILAPRSGKAYKKN